MLAWRIMRQRPRHLCVKSALDRMRISPTKARSCVARVSGNGRTASRGVRCLHLLRSLPLSSLSVPIIETEHKRMRWRWVLLLVLMSQSRVLVMFAAGSMILTMREFIESPMITKSVSSLDILFNLLVAAPYRESFFICQPELRGHLMDRGDRAGQALLRPLALILGLHDPPPQIGGDGMRHGSWRRRRKTSDASRPGAEDGGISGRGQRRVLALMTRVPGSSSTAEPGIERLTRWSSMWTAVAPKASSSIAILVNSGAESLVF